MPTYDYVCDACGHSLEVFHSISEAPKKKCPECGKSKLVRQIGAGAGFLFKGGGFYKTDYRSDDYHADAKKDSDAAKPAAESAKSDSTGSADKKADDKKAADKKADGASAPKETKSAESKNTESRKTATDAKPKKKSKD
jgi:putative FmdB family regulatory protein